MTERTLDQAALKTWIGKTETATDLIESGQARLLQATFDRPAELRDGDALPPLWHWIYFPVAAPLGELGRDGHPELGGFLPPVALPRRMWAGGRFEFTAPLRLGETVTKASEIRDAAVKAGRSGTLCFVTVRHSYFGADGSRRFIEEHDIVYREDPRPGTLAPAPASPPQDPVWSSSVAPSPVLLFRYSALTFNGPRIHYDRDYCREVEGYPGLIFHGPLTATLLADLAMRKRPGGEIRGFKFRAVAPLFDTAPVVLRGKPGGSGPQVMELWAETPQGGLAMQATAHFAT